MVQTDNTETNIAAFELVVSQYQELSFSSGDLQAMQYGKGAESGKATCTGSSSIINPSNSDLICEVEIAARRSLGQDELRHFNQYYKSGEIVVSPDDTEEFIENLAGFPEIAALDFSMRCKLGAQLIKVGVHPVSTYMKPIDVRAPKPSKQRWSHLYGN